MKMTILVEKPGWTVTEWLTKSWRLYLCSSQQHGWCKRKGRCRDRIRGFLGDDAVAKLAQCCRYRREIRIEKLAALKGAR